MNPIQEQISSYCQQWASSLQPYCPPGVDAKTLLWAFTGNESSYGTNMKPRHEPAFDVGGIYGENEPQKSLLAQYGSAAACSFGPLQIMFCNCPTGTTIEEASQLDTVFMCSVSYMSRQFRRFTPQSIEECGSIWNAGHIPNPFPAGVAKYANDLVTRYNGGFGSIVEVE